VPPRPKIAVLPDEIRAQLDKELVKRGFSGYDALETWLDGLGISIGKSSIQRYGKGLEKKLAAIRASTAAARLIAEEAPDDADQRSGAVMSMLQTEIFEMLVGMQELEQEDDPVARAKVLSSLAKNVATLSRASVHQKRHEIEIRGKVTAAADKVARLAQKGGASAETLATIRAEILGIVPQ
jgi:hypothetical protein